MKRRLQNILIALSLIFSVTISQAQGVAIQPTNGTATADPSAMLDIKSTTSGLLIPRMTLEQRNAITSPATGLMVFQTDNTPGFYYYAQSMWNPWNTAGPQGIQGVPGAIGQQGMQGLQGEVGPQGPIGNVGPQGVQGDQGPQGPQGPIGVQGTQGIQGAQGVAGADGLQGPAGQGGVTIGSSTIAVSGAGTSASPYVINANEPTYSLGLNPSLGGYVFFLTSNGKHGLVVEATNQSGTWYDAQNIIDNLNVNHDANSMQFTNWRLPSKYEAGLLYNFRFNMPYIQYHNLWTSTVGQYGIGAQTTAYSHQFTSNVVQTASAPNTLSIWAIRSF